MSARPGPEADDGAAAGPPGAAAGPPGAAAPAVARSGGDLRVEVVTDLDDLARLSAPWQRLLATSPEATAFASPAFLLAWYRHFERPGGVYAVTVWRGGELVGLAPFGRTTLGLGPTRATLLVSAGTEHGDYGDPLLGPDPAPVAEVVTEHLVGLTGRRTAVNLRRLRVDGALWAAVHARGDVDRRPMGQVADAAVVRFDLVDGDPAAFLRRQARRMDVTRRLRRLEEAHGPVGYVAGDPDVAAALDAMRDMLARRWTGGGGPRLFRAPGLEAFTRAAVADMVADGHARVDCLVASGRRLTVSTMLQVGDRHIGDATASDPGLSAYGLGHAAIHGALVHALGQGARQVDLRAGDFPYKRRWANAAIRTRSVALTPGGRGGEVTRAARRVAMSARARRLARVAATGPAGRRRGGQPVDRQPSRSGPASSEA